MIDIQPHCAISTTASSAVGSGSVLAAAVGAGFDWHFAPTHPAPSRREGERTVGVADVERLHTVRAEFIALDRSHGGGHAFTWLVDHLDGL